MIRYLQGKLSRDEKQTILDLKIFHCLSSIVAFLVFLFPVRGEGSICQKFSLAYFTLQAMQKMFDCKVENVAKTFCHFSFAPCAVKKAQNSEIERVILQRKS